jgi:hypothetical protein
VCDANEFVLEVEESFGYDWPPVDSPEWDPYITVVNEAIAIVEARIFPLGK